MAYFPMQNKFLQLFRLYPDSKPVHCPLTALTDIRMTSDRDVSWSCEYCKSVIPSNVYLCPGCQSPRSVAELSCVALFTGVMPHGNHLLGLGEKDVMEVVTIRTGPIGVYVEDSVVIRLTDFKINKIALPNLMAIGPEDVCRLDCLVEAGCNVKFYFDKMFEKKRK